MLTQEECKALESKMFARIDKQYNKEDSMAALISKIAVKEAIATLQEYEKMNKQNQ